MQLTDLPAELLSKLPHYLNTLNDWYALIRISPCVYKACTETKATFLPIFPGDLNLHIIAGSARQLADWAVSKEENRSKLGNTLSYGGNKGLLESCIEVARWSPAHVQRLYEAKMEIIYPLSRLLEDDRTCADTARPFFVYLTYCELFHHSVDEAYGQLAPNISPLPPMFRQH